MTAWITCPACGRPTYNSHDIREGYCGRCNWWTHDPAMLAAWQRRWPEKAAVAAAHREGLLAQQQLQAMPGMSDAILICAVDPGEIRPGESYAQAAVRLGRAVHLRTDPPAAADPARSVASSAVAFEEGGPGLPKPGPVPPSGAADITAGSSDLLPCRRGWPASTVHPGTRDGPCGYPGCCNLPGPDGADIDEGPDR